jgi:hypothetical protein
MKEPIQDYLIIWLIGKFLKSEGVVDNFLKSRPFSHQYSGPEIMKAHPGFGCHGALH